MNSRFYIHVEEYGKQLDMLNIEQKGRLLEALIMVARDQTPDETDMDDLTVMCFSFFRDRMLRDFELSQKRSDSGSKGGRPKAKESKEKQTKANENKEKQDKAPKPKPKPIPKPNIKDICASDPDPDEDEAEKMFRKIWEQYPQKRGLGSVTKEQKVKLWKEIGEEHLLRALRRYTDDIKSKETRGDFVPAWQNGDTWFNTGYMDYLDGNYSPSQADPKPKKTANGFCNYQQTEISEEVQDRLYQLQFEDS